MHNSSDHDLGDFNVVSRVIESRKTEKVLADPSSPLWFDDCSFENELVNKSIAAAGWAPFHYMREPEVGEPWRCHVIWHAQCRHIAKEMVDWFPDMKPTNKLPSMLSACGALVLVTWLPQDDTDISDPEKREAINLEHLAATSSMVQNLLLLLESANLGSYWSSGGQFKSAEMFSRLKIPSAEKLAAAVFVDYPQSKDHDVQRIPGKSRQRRTGPSHWTREINSLG